MKAKKRVRTVEVGFKAAKQLPARAAAETSAGAVAGLKLTKQQKRDLKRAGKVKESHVNVVAAKATVTAMSVYKRVPERVAKCPREYQLEPRRFMTPRDSNFANVMQCCYPDFVISTPDQFGSSFHERFRAAMQGLEEVDHAYQFDLTQPAGLGTKLAKTFVSRCLVGEPGISYKYLGLRMFAHPWREGECGATPNFIEIGRLNDEMVLHTKQLLQQSGKAQVGSCSYNLTLINRCFPSSCESIRLKDEPMFAAEKATVSWHADSSLAHYSSIGVYHCTRKLQTTPPVAEGVDTSWRVALRVSHNAEGPLLGKPKDEDEDDLPPPVAVPLPDAHAYFLLDDFNHNHQHMVLAGDTDRFASTHRVGREDGHTFLSIKTRCKNALQGSGQSSKQIRSEQLALLEVEFEFIRQFYIQGELHFGRHVWWHSPMEELLGLWGELEMRTSKSIEVLRDAAFGIEEEAELQATMTDSLSEKEQKKAAKKIAKRKKRAATVQTQSFTELILALEQREKKRSGWLEREKDPLFKSVHRNCRPMAIPFPSSPMQSSEISTVCNQLAQWRTLFATK